MREHNKVLQSGAVATGVGEPLTVAGHTSVVAQVTGAFVGTVQFEGLVAENTWVDLLMTNMTTGATSTVANAPGLFRAIIAGLRGFRARVAVYTSGAVTVTAVASEGG